MKTNEIKETIVFNYNDPYSIRKAEKRKSYLENNHYSQSFTQNIGFDKWKIVYTKQAV